METEKLTFLGWLSSHSDVLIPVFSAFLGTIIGYFFTSTQSRRERKWRIYDPIISLRIDAHRNLLKLIQELTFSNIFPHEGGSLEYISIFRSPELFTDFNKRFIEFSSANFLWFSPDILKSILEFNCYFADIKKLISAEIQKPEISEIKIYRLGSFLMKDFIKIGKTVIIQIHDFLNSDLTKSENNKYIENLVIRDEVSQMEKEKFFGGLDFYLKYEELITYISENEDS